MGTSVDLSKCHPSSQQAAALWDAYRQNAHPLAKICFDWDLEQMRTEIVSAASACIMSAAKHAFTFAIYLISVRSLSNEECYALLNQPRDIAVSEFQKLCEQALAMAHFLSTSDVMVIQALALYIVSFLQSFLGSCFYLRFDKDCGD